MSDTRKSKDFDRMMVEAVQENYSFFAWQSIGGIVEKCELKVKAYRKDYSEIELEVCAGHEEKLAKVISGNRILNIYVPEMSVSFSSELKGVSVEKKVKLYRPTDYTFYERRKHERVMPAKTCYVSFEYSKQMYKKAIYDLSLGGLAIILPKSDKLIISKGKELPVVVLEVHGRKIKAKVECANSFSVDRFKFENLPYGGFKIAFRFTEMSKEDRAYLAGIITHESVLQQIKKKAN